MEDQTPNNGSLGGRGGTIHIYGAVASVTADGSNYASYNWSGANGGRGGTVTVYTGGEVSGQIAARGGVGENDGGNGGEVTISGTSGVVVVDGGECSWNNGGDGGSISINAGATSGNLFARGNNGWNAGDGGTIDYPPSTSTTGATKLVNEGVAAGGDAGLNGYINGSHPI